MLVALSLVAATAATAAEKAAADPGEMKPMRLEAPEWYMVEELDFHAGKQDRAAAMVREYFAPASAASGSPMPQIFVHSTGPWDWTLMWQLEGGITDLEWVMSPDNIRWMQAFSEAVGGMDEAQKLLDEFRGLVARSDRRLVRRLDQGIEPEASAADEPPRRRRRRR